MIILDKPYVSEFLKQTIIDQGIPVLDNATARTVFGSNGAQRLNTEHFISQARKQGKLPRIYANSENAIQWIDAHLNECALPGYIRMFKNKVLFRELLREDFPDFFFKNSTLSALRHIDPGTLEFPLVVKPAVGFFSLGVHVVHNIEEWNAILEVVEKEVAGVQGQYPMQVLDMERFLIEACIGGEEFAVDAYYNEDGRVVIINILGHLFASSSDVSDRVYVTSPTIIEEWLDPFRKVLQKIGDRARLRNFPIHAELRSDPKRGIVPIEINPMRFAGWCCTDVAHYAYGVNPYDCYLQSKEPHWPSILEKRKGNVWSIVVADLPPHLDRSRITAVDYASFTAQFSTLLEFRPVDYRRYSVFGFAFVRVPENDLRELRNILGKDLSSYLTYA